MFRNCVFLVVWIGVTWIGVVALTSNADAQELLAYWNFDGTLADNGTTLTDVTGNGNNGLLDNPQTTAVLPIWRPTSGINGSGALRFQSIQQDMVVVPDFNYGDSGNFTTSIWTKADTDVHPGGARNWQYFWSTGNFGETGAFNYYVINREDQNGNEDPSFHGPPHEYRVNAEDDNTGTSGNVTTTGAAVHDVWRMLTTTYSTTDGMKIYVDGVLAGADPLVTGPVGSSGKDMFFGRRADGSTTRLYGTGQAFDDVDDSAPANDIGLLDEAAIWDFTLTAEQVTTAFTEGVMSVLGPTPGLSGDFDSDDDVDGADFLEWQRNLGDASSLADWEATYGMVAPLAAANAVPEPSSWLLVCTMAMATFTCVRQRRIVR